MAVYGTFEPHDQVTNEPLVQRSHNYLKCSNQIYCCKYLYILFKSKIVKGNFTNADLDNAVKDVLKHGLGPMMSSMMHQM